MNPDTIRNWTIKAEHDYKIGLNEFRSEKPVTDMICFHMQQCAEKYLKAYLAYNDIEINKTHDLAVLLKDCMAVDDSFRVLLDRKVPMLTPYGTVIRYPDDFYMPTLKETEEAISLAEVVRDFVREKFKSTGFKLE
ncbi:DNA-binding protein [candidate division LCP-89 bacterium B3_LCP]|uniref:DNA-binding protein n=1 Tax=candidate division LCP-89 bacterium B3_LCP TaxID=2012998 RepID=A0A532USQ2_UNCL8|nr:MAG: DNA-binding protein [candidate division LCP-89 bacterium B3_LCP]